MRLFISREDIEQDPIRDSLSDRSAVVSFGMIYGIDLDTPNEVEALITGARARNIPLHLIGHAGNAFDRHTLSMKAGKTPRRWLDALIIITIFSAYACALTLTASIFTKDVLIRIKATMRKVATRLALSASRSSTSEGSCRNWISSISLRPLYFRTSRPLPATSLTSFASPRQSKRRRRKACAQRQLHRDQSVAHPSSGTAITKVRSNPPLIPPDHSKRVILTEWPPKMVPCPTSSSNGWSCAHAKGNAFLRSSWQSKPKFSVAPSCSSGLLILSFKRSSLTLNASPEI